MNGRSPRVDQATLDTLRQMAAAYMSTKDLGGPEIGVLPSVAEARELDQRWRQAWTSYSLAETNQAGYFIESEVFGPGVDVSALGPVDMSPFGRVIDLEWSKPQRKGGQHGKRVRRSSSRK
jgi:hypothetical protein